MDRLDATRGRSPVPAPPRGFAPGYDPAPLQGARVPGYVFSPPMVAPGGAYSIRPYTGTHNKPTGL